MPRRSTGCYACRSRKVRCDEGNPQCRRCTDYGIVCPGYRPPPEKDLRFVEAIPSSSQPQPGNMNTTAPNKKAFQRLKWQQQNISPPATKLTPLSNHSVHRTQLLSTFLHLYLPKRNNPNLTAKYTYITTLPTIDLASPLLQISIDTLCLVEIGSLYENESLLRESRTNYVRALPMLARELARPDSKRMPSDHLLAVISLLGLCELYDAISESAEFGNPGKGWKSHINGAERFVDAIGPDALATPIGRLLFQNVRHESGCLGLAKRKATVFGEKRWLDFTSDLARTNPAVALYDIIVQIPGFLERADTCINSLDPSDDYEGIIQQCTTLCSNLSNWHTTWITPDLPYTLVDVVDMQAFTTLINNRTFQTVYDFTSAQACLHLQLYWLCDILLSSALLSLLKSTDTHEPQQRDIHRRLYVSCTSLCRSIPFCCHADVASVGRMGTFLIRVVERFFESAGYCVELEWCKAVRIVFSTPKMSRCDKISSIGHEKAVPTKPWEVTHGCKAAICNFRVECLAPAPMSLEGHYPTTTYVPRRQDEDDSHILR